MLSTRLAAASRRGLAGSVVKGAGGALSRVGCSVPWSSGGAGPRGMGGGASVLDDLLSANRYGGGEGKAHASLSQVKTRALNSMHPPPNARSSVGSGSGFRVHRFEDYE